MTKIRYWTLFVLVSAFLAGAFFVIVFELSRFSSLTLEKVLAYSFILIGFTNIYFGFLRPHWFAKEIIPAASPIKLKVKNKISTKPSLRDDSYFWNVFPHALFFCVGGIAYLLYPAPTSILVAAGCSAWVQILYKYV